MQTTTQVYFKDASSMGELDDGSVHLIVTSPPYPMIEMWDDMFRGLDAEVGIALDLKDGQKAFTLMHEVMRPVWEECYRVLSKGGILCLNVGDATRRIGNQFQLFPNHARVTDICHNIGFKQLPGVLWRKPTNSPSKFMGSGALGLNAYVTLEHEHILIFRKGAKRAVTGNAKDRRYESAYFWEERNNWFSDVWTDLRGVQQETHNGHADLRERSGAFPLDLPLRLIEMYSIYGDTVLDPFWGTGTTSLASAIAGRSSIGYEIEKSFLNIFETQIYKAPYLSRMRNESRIKKHRDFISHRNNKGKPAKYENVHYGFDVIMRQEKRIRLYDAKDVNKEGDTWLVTYSPHAEQKDLFANS